MNKTSMPTKAGLSERTEIVLAGVGGQGLVFLGGLIGDAAVRAGFHAVQTQSYGVASRGGFTKAEVVLAQKPVAYPMVTEPDVVLALTEEALTRYRDIPSGCSVVYDSDNVSASADFGCGFSFTSVARENDLSKSYNVLALGSLIHITKIIDPEVIREGLDGSNLKAFQMGLDLAEKERKI